MSVTYKSLGVGCYVDCSADSADTCNERTIAFARDYGFEHAPLPPEDAEDYSQALSETGDDALEYLNGLETRSFMYWKFEDNSLFLTVDIDGAKEDCGFVSSRTQEEPDADFEGEWLHVNDHGNATLYVREGGKDREIWSVV